MARVYVSTVVNARNDRVWARVRDFNGMPNWHPAIAESRIEGGEPADKIGCVRDFRLRNGDQTFLEWTAEFDCAPERENELVSNIGTGVFQGGFDALKRAFGG